MVCDKDELKQTIPQALKTKEVTAYLGQWKESSGRATVLLQVKRTPQDSINEFIIRKWNPLVVVDLHSCMRNASVNSGCAQSPAPPGWPPGISIFLPWIANCRGWGLLCCQIPRGGDEKRGQMPRPPSTLQHFSLIAQSNNAVLSILMCDFLFQLTSSFVTALGF